MTANKLTRTGDAPLVFDGERLAEAGESRVGGRDLNRWHELTVYQSGTQYVVAIGFHTRWDGETSRHHAHVCSTPDEVRNVLRDYDPVPDGIGYPPGEHYDAKRAALESQLRVQYDDCVSSVLDDDEFAVTVEGAVDDQYAGMDHEAIMSFVRTQLRELGLSRNEACVVCDANNGAMLLDTPWLGLAANIEDTPASELSEKWDCDAMEVALRIRETDRGTEFALAYAVAQFWRHCDLDTDQALELAGFAIVANG